MNKLLILLASATLGYFPVLGQTQEEEITRTFQFAQPDADNALILHNITGDVQIIGYDGEEVLLTAQKQVRAKNQQDLARGQQEVQLVTEAEGKRIWVYLEAPFIEAERKGDKLNYQMHRDDEDYQFRFDFTVKVPTRTNLRVSTINDGDVRIEGVASEQVDANNINGNIRGTALAGQTRAQTINGDIDITYATAPPQESQFRTINGDINLTFPSDLSADVRFKSMNGDLFTDFPKVANLPAQVQTNQNPSGPKTTYRIDKSTQVRIGDGGPLLDFDVLNGSVYLKQN